MKLWSSSTSPYARKVRVVVMEKGLSDQIEEVFVKTSPLNTDEELAARNPLGKIPCLTLEDGENIVDSRVICYYLDDIGNGAVLQPSGNVRHKVLVALGDGVLDAAVSMTYERVVRPPEYHYEPWVDAQWNKVVSTLKYIEAEYMDVLAHFNLAAIGLVSAVEYLDLRHGERSWRAVAPELAEWHAALHSRESFVATRPKE